MFHFTLNGSKDIVYGKKVQLLGATLYIMNSNKSNISITLNKNYFVGTAQLLSRLSDNLRLTAVDLFCAIVQQQLSESLTNCRANCNHIGLPNYMPVTTPHSLMSILKLQEFIAAYIYTLEAESTE